MKTLFFAIILCVCAHAQTNCARMLSGVNSQTGRTYTFQAVDATRLTTFANALPVTVTLPNGATTGFGACTEFDAQNLGPGTATITCTGCLIYSSSAVGQATFALTAGQGVELFGSGTNYFALQIAGLPLFPLPLDEYRTISNNPSLLANHWRYLHSTPVYQGTYPSQGMDVIVPNDSLWEGDVTNSAMVCAGNNTAVPQYSQNRQAEQIRIALQGQYGYGGTGLQPIINVSGCALVNPELYTAAPAGLTLTGMIGPQYGSNFSVVQMATGQVITWNGGGLPYTFVRTYCADNASSNQITVAIDGNAVGTACGTHNASAIARVITSSPNQPFTNHSTTFTCALTPCFLYGAEGRPSTGSGNAGVRVHNLSVGSAPAEWFAGHTDFEDLISNGVSANGSAQLIIYAMGTNEVGLGISLATYQASFQSYFAHELAKTPEPPVIVIYRPGMDSIASQSYFAALTAYGYANNMLVIDQTNRWGSTYVPGAWYLGNDNIHFNDGGNLDAATTILAGILDVQNPAPINPTYGDTGLNPGVVGVTAPTQSGFIGTPGYTWQNVPGIPSMKGIYGWQTGNGNNLPGTVGLFDPAYAGVVWGTSISNDFCVHTPTSGANFATCAGADLKVSTATGTTNVKGLSVISSNGTELLCSGTLPTFTSGFNTNGTIGASANGTCSFTVTVGSGVATNTGVIGLPTATSGWNCFATNGNRADVIQETSGSASSVTLTNLGTTFVATNWTNGDTILVSCFAR